uniref:Uncharacterized protein n=1 Tax=Ignisphaera aggregans TaxID=334771 RepID=A0A7J3QD01_9CREN
MVIAISKLIVALDLVKNISEKCQDVDTFIDIGKAFLYARYSYADDYKILALLKTLCPCIKDVVYNL